MIKYALSKSYDEMKSTLQVAGEDLNNEELKKEVNYRVGTFLHWLINNYERLEQSADVSHEDKSFFSGLRYANNKLKHDINAIKVYQRTGGFSFPMTFPLSIEAIQFKWCEYKREINPNYENQFKNYVRFIQGNEILQISEKALSIINSIRENEK